MERVQALVESPEPLIRLLGRRLGAPPPSGADPVLEVLTRRYYRRRSLENLRSFLLDGRTCVTGDYELNGERLHLVALMAQSGNLPAALSSLAELVAGVGGPDARGGRPLPLLAGPAGGPRRARRRSLRGQLTDVEVLRSVRRVTVTVCTPDGDVETLTFRPCRGRARRGGRHPRDAPADRAAARPVAAEELRRPSACRRPRTPTCSTSSRRRTRTTSGSSRWRRCAT